MTALPPQRSAAMEPSGPATTTPPPQSAVAAHQQHNIQQHQHNQQQQQQPSATNASQQSNNAPIDCYEDMFKEITRKLYGEEGLPDYPGAERALTSLVSADHRSLTTIDYDAEGNAFKPEDHITAFGLAALMQNGFPPPGILNANFAPKLTTTTNNGTGNAEDKWTSSEEILPWTASRIASYNPAQKLFRCAECECVGFLGRVAEHWLGAHGALRPFQCPQCPYASAWSRCAKIHLTREHNIPDASAEAVFKENPVLDEVTRYLQRLKGKVESPGIARAITAPVGNTQVSVAANNNTTTAEASADVETPAATPAVTKRYNCGFCPYATDRRDLYTRHENIHREEKPFQCYVCQKQFNRADHVKKHFLRMHREHPYDLNRIRKQPSPNKSPVYAYPKFGEPGQQQQIAGGFQNQPSTAAAANIGNQSAVRIEQKIDTKVGIKQEKSGSPKKKGEKRYACCYCSWAGVDNWCLKRHLNTHLKPFVCGLCDYKAARSERLATHVLKVHNKKACGKCNFLAEDQAQLVIHQQEQHALDTPRQPRSASSSTSSPGQVAAGGILRSLGPLAPFAGAAGGASNIQTGGIVPLHNTVTPFGSIVANVRPNLNDQQQQQQQQAHHQQHQQQWRPQKQGAERLFHYMEVSDGSDPDDQHYTSRLQPVMQTISQDFHKAGGMQRTNKRMNNENNGISPGKRMRLDENVMGNKENIDESPRLPHQYNVNVLRRNSAKSARDKEDIAKSPEVLNLKVRCEEVINGDQLCITDDAEQFYMMTSDDIHFQNDDIDDKNEEDCSTFSDSRETNGKRSRKQTQPRKVAHKTNAKVTLASIRDEYLTKHITRKSLNCDLCPNTEYAYHTELSLAVHMNLRHADDILPCSYCGKGFAYDFLVKTHRKDCMKTNSAITNNNSASVSRPKILIDQRVPDF